MPTTIEALVIIPLVISPGYVFARVAGDVIAFAREPGDLRFLLPTVTAGTFVHIIMSFWTMRTVDHYDSGTLRDHPVEVVVWGATTIYLVPALLGVCLGRLSNVPRVDRVLDRIGLGYIDRMPSAWDFVMRLERPAYVRVHLKNGDVIGGVFSTKSFASTTPERPDLFLEQGWQLDERGTFIQPLVDNWGVWIAHESIERIEFFDSGADREHWNGDERTTDDAE